MAHKNTFLTVEAGGVAIRWPHSKIFQRLNGGDGSILGNKNVQIPAQLGRHQHVGRLPHRFWR